MPDKEAPPETAIVKQEPGPLEQVAENLAHLKPKEDPLVTVSAKSLADVLPLKFYEGASEMKLNADELAKLAEVTDATDDIVDIRPDGLIYVQHIHYRRALTALFGTEWALLPGSGLAFVARCPARFAGQSVSIEGFAGVDVAAFVVVDKVSKVFHMNLLCASLLFF